MKTPTRTTAVAIAVLASTPLGIGPAQASDADTQVSLVAVEDYVTGTGVFQARGGGLCSSGTTTQPDGVVVTERRRTLTFELDKVFTCDDGTGTFTLRLRAWYLPCRPADRGVWKVVGGTGAYQGLQGSGQLKGTYTPAPCTDGGGVQDAYTGHVRR